MYEYGKLVRLVRARWYQERLRSDATKSILKEMSVDLEADEKMWSEREE
jgi:hypothetical protein